MSFTVAIVGRPNVGKSTLFNRLVGRREALVDDRPGVTRDRRSGTARLGGLDFTVIDTAGLEEATGDTLEARMRRQTERAVAEADVALLLIDARAGVMPLDRHFADLLRRSPTPVLLVANKCEGRAGEAGLLDAYALGLGEPIAVSAAHGEGMAELLEALLPYAGRAADAAPGTGSELEPEASAAPAAEAAEDAPGKGAVERGEAEGTKGAAETEAERGPIRLAIVGRPNVGKSTLVNALLGDERVLTGPEPGVTRDAIAIDWTWRGRAVRLVDTAGLRRRARIDEALERLSVGDTLNAIRLAEVVVLVVDAAAILEKQDLAIARHVIEEGRALVIAVNKWDQVTDTAAAQRQLRDRLEASLAQVPGVPAVTLSALKGRRLDRLMDAVLAIYDTWNRRVPTAQLNRWLAAALESHPPPVVKGRRLKLRYMTQVKARPPTFAIWTSRPEELSDSYTRYLLNGLREAFDLAGVPLRLLLRKGKNPYAES